MTTHTTDQNAIHHDITISKEILRIQKSLREEGYARTSDAALELPSCIREYFATLFFTEKMLGSELPYEKLPQDRKRSRDVVEYRRKPGSMILNEYPITAQPPVPEADIHVPREYQRFYALEDQHLVTWAGNFLSMIPIGEQQDHGTMCINLVRTRSKVSPYKHQDNEQFIYIYVVAREAGGGVTSLHPIDNPEKTVLAAQLQPGEYLIFRDSDFLHDATPLEPRFEGDKPYRDVIISLMHYPNSYLNAKQ